MKKEQKNNCNEDNGTILYIKKQEVKKDEDLRLFFKEVDLDLIIEYNDIDGIEKALNDNLDILIIGDTSSRTGFSIARNILKHKPFKKVICVSDVLTDVAVISGHRAGISEMVGNVSAQQLISICEQKIHRAKQVSPISELLNHGQVIKYGDLKLDTSTSKVYMNDMYLTELSPICTKILAFFMHPDNAGIYRTKEDIYTSVWNDDCYIDTRSTNNSITNAIGTIRKVIENDAANPTRLINGYGKGYKLECVYEYDVKFNHK